MGTHLRVLRELSNEYQYDRVYMFFQKSLHPCALEESRVLEGLNIADERACVFSGAST